MRALAETEAADAFLIAAVKAGESFASIAREQVVPVSRAAVGQRYARALARQKKRAELAEENGE